MRMMNRKFRILHMDLFFFRRGLSWGCLPRDHCFRCRLLVGDLGMVFRGLCYNNIVFAITVSLSIQ